MNLLPVDFHKEDVYGVEDDFLHGAFATGVAQDNGFTSTHPVGAITMGDARGGTGLFTFTAAADEYLSHTTTNEIFEFVEDKPIRFIAKTLLPITLGNELNIFVGCMENMDSASEFVAAGGGLRLADTDGFGFFTPEAGGAVYPNTEDLWHCWSNFGDVQQVTPLLGTNLLNLLGADVKAWDGAAGVGQCLSAEWVPVNVVPGVGAVAPTLLDAEVRFWVGGRLACKHLMRGVNQITIAGTQEMNFGLVGENLTDIASMSCDYLKCEQVR